jgi:ribosomal-protein-serine acetyltransferase
MFRWHIGEDLELRLMEERHAEDFHALVMKDKEHFREWLDWPIDENYTVEDARGFIKRALQRFANNNGFEAGIWLEGKLVGEVSYDRIDWTNRIAEAGYSLGPEFQGRGIATRCTRALVDYAFDELKLNRVELRCAALNHKSRAIPERLGFTAETTQRQAWWLRDRFVDVVIYSMLADEWQAKRAETLR